MGGFSGDRLRMQGAVRQGRRATAPSDPGRRRPRSAPGCRGFRQSGIRDISVVRCAGWACAACAGFRHRAEAARSGAPPRACASACCARGESRPGDCRGAGGPAARGRQSRQRDPPRPGGETVRHSPGEVVQRMGPSCIARRDSAGREAGPECNREVRAVGGRGCRGARGPAGTVGRRGATRRQGCAGAVAGRVGHVGAAPAGLVGRQPVSWSTRSRQMPRGCPGGTLRDAAGAVLAMPTRRA